MTIKLDPKEVRAHLHRLGYCNITGEQLKDFIKDLKKLIKYDQRLLCTCKELNEVSGSSYIETSPGTFRTSNSMSSHTENEYNHAEGHKTAHTHDHMEQKYVTCARSLVHTVQSDDGCGRSSCSTAVPNVSAKAKKSIHFSKEKENQKTVCIANLQESVKPKSSFIRPWNINPRQNVGAPKRCDPVKLYHHYQDIWRQQKVPGEDNHYDLQWSVQERMLSEDPHPREDYVRQVLEEMKALFEQNQRDVNVHIGGDAGYLSGVHLRHTALERNKRCLLAYLYES